MNLQWRWYLPFVLIYHYIIPVKYFFIDDIWVTAYGLQGIYETFRQLPFSFFVTPLIIFFFLKFSLFVFNSFELIGEKRKEVKPDEEI